MKRFSQFELTKELILLFTFGAILILYSAFPGYYYRTLHIQAQLQPQQQQPKFQDEYSDYIPTTQQKRIYSLKIDTSIN